MSSPYWKDQDRYWTVIRPGDDFPEGGVRAMGRGLECKGQPHCDLYVALWVRPEGEAIFGRAWNEGGKAKAAFPFEGKVVSGDDTEGYRILKYCGPAKDQGFKFRWVRANEAKESDLFYSGEFMPVVVCDQIGNESLGKAKWSTKTAYTCVGDTEICHEGLDFGQNCFVLLTEPVSAGHNETPDDANAEPSA